MGLGWKNLSHRWLVPMNWVFHNSYLQLAPSKVTQEIRIYMITIRKWISHFWLDMLWLSHTFIKEQWNRTKQKYKTTRSLAWTCIIVNRFKTVLIIVRQGWKSFIRSKTNGRLGSFRAISISLRNQTLMVSWNCGCSEIWKRWKKKVHSTQHVNKYCMLKSFECQN